MNSNAFSAEIEGVAATNSDGTHRQDLIVELAEALDEHQGDFPLRLLRLHADSEDPNAIAVLDRKGRLLGHVAKKVAAGLAPKIDSGIPYRAFAVAVTGGAPGMDYGVDIRIEAVARNFENAET